MGANPLCHAFEMFELATSNLIEASIQTEKVVKDSEELMRRKEDFANAKDQYNNAKQNLKNMFYADQRLHHTKMAVLQAITAPVYVVDPPCGH